MIVLYEIYIYACVYAYIYVTFMCVYIHSLPDNKDIHQHVGNNYPLSGGESWTLNSIFHLNLIFKMSLMELILNMKIDKVI